MEDLEKSIAKELKVLEEMIKLQLDKEKIDKQRKIVDKLLKEYLKDIWKQEGK